MSAQDPKRLTAPLGEIAGLRKPKPVPPPPDPDPTGCCPSGKVTFTKEHAAEMAKRFNAVHMAVHRRGQNKASAYRCDWCHHWHIGHRR